MLLQNIFLHFQDYLGNNMIDLNGTTIHSGLIKEFISHGHYVTIISPIQKRQNTSDKVIKGEGYEIHKPHIGNITNNPSECQFINFESGSCTCS